MQITNSKLLIVSVDDISPNYCSENCFFHDTHSSQYTISDVCHLYGKSDINAVRLILETDTKNWKPIRCKQCIIDFGGN